MVHNWLNFPHKKWFPPHVVAFPLPRFHQNDDIKASNATRYLPFLAVPLPTLGHSQGDIFTSPMLITAFWQCWPECTCEIPPPWHNLIISPPCKTTPPHDFSPWNIFWNNKRSRILYRGDTLPFLHWIIMWEYELN